MSDSANQGKTQIRDEILNKPTKESHTDQGNLRKVGLSLS